MNPKQYQELIKSRIARSYNNETVKLTDNELEESAIIFFEKGGKRAAIGERRTHGGREYIKTANGWKYTGKEKGKKAQEHIKNHSSSEKKENSSQNNDSGSQTKDKKEQVKKYIGDMSRAEKLSVAKQFGIKDADKLPTSSLDRKIIDANIKKKFEDFKSAKREEKESFMDKQRRFAEEGKAERDSKLKENTVGKDKSGNDVSRKDSDNFKQKGKDLNKRLFEYLKKVKENPKQNLDSSVYQKLEKEVQDFNDEYDSKFKGVKFDHIDDHNNHIQPVLTSEKRINQIAKMHGKKFTKK